MENQTKKRFMMPPWMALPRIERGSMLWRMGEGEAYLEKWAAWYRSLEQKEKKEYLRLFPEPLMWRGFVTGEKVCDDVRQGKLHVTLWRKKGEPRYSRSRLVSAFEAGEKPDMLMFWGHQPAKDGAFTKSCFSQWYEAEFVHGGVEYCCMEQCMMAGKAKLFEDGKTLEKIMRSRDPREIKALGRIVKNFDEKAWNRMKYTLIVNGNYNKFSQNPRLRDFLLSTGDSILVEASPYDRIWGIGLPEEDPRAEDPGLWRGENLLGFALMEVRDEIRRVYANEGLCFNPWEEHR